MVGLKRISTAFGLLAALASVGAGPGVAPNANQSTADCRGRARFASSRNLAGYRIEIQARDGLVTLTGELGSPGPESRGTRSHPVCRRRARRDRPACVSNDAAVRPVQYQPAAPAYRPDPGYAVGGDDVTADRSTASTAGPINGGMTYGAGIRAPIDDGGPVPEGPAGMAGATQAAQPGYPNYAWPSYAPYPNFSAVGYPTAYPWQAWPNIGPFYPYPEVPLDWRAVTLRWDDGIWWLDFKKHYTRPFFTPYPFGLFAY